MKQMFYCEMYATIHPVIGFLQSFSCLKRREAHFHNPKDGAVCRVFGIEVFVRHTTRSFPFVEIHSTSDKSRLLAQINPADGWLPGGLEKDGTIVWVLWGI